jgi:photosystem II stability/assembly factor-like uncharacterized protein
VIKRARILAHARMLAVAALAAVLLPQAGLAQDGTAPPARATLTAQSSQTTALLQAVSVVDSATVWVSGHAGTWARTTDGGAHWQPGRVPDADAETLEFRDVHAASADEAWLLAAGPGERSRIYHTTDGGRSWTLQHTNPDPKGFYDCFAFWDSRHGVAFGDQVDGRTAMLETSDGAHWTALLADRLPAPAGTEGGFAASGTCVTTLGRKLGWVATGAGSEARVFRTEDRGAHWTAVATPAPSGATAGLASVVFRDPMHGAALGGDVAAPASQGQIVVSADGGRSWTAGTRPPFPGAVYGAAYAIGTRSPVLVAVGPGGMALSRDDARSWKTLDSLAYWSVGFGSNGVGWAVGPKGRITRIDPRP